MSTSDATFQLLVVDDQMDLAEELRDMLSEELGEMGSLEIRIETDFDKAEQCLARELFDMVVLDVQLKPDAVGPAEENRGRDLYQRVAQTRWVPVVFCTAWPERVRDLERPPFVAVVNKSHLAEVVTAVREGLSCEVPAVTRNLHELIDGEVRGFLRDIVAPHWQEMAARDHDEIVLVLVNRLAAWLKEHAVRELERRLGDMAGGAVDTPSAAKVYLFPPVTGHLTAADLVVDDQEAWWLVLTPACDMFETAPGVTPARTAKAQYVRLAKADTAAESPTIAAWLDGNGSKEKAKSVFKAGSNRFMHLPKYLNIPDLLVDFENLRSEEIGVVRSWQRKATLDSPFAEAALAAFSQSAGRIGTPDVPFDHLWESLEAEAGHRRSRPSVG